MSTSLDLAVVLCSKHVKGSASHAVQVADAQLIPAHEWEARLFALSALCVAWSPMCAVATGSQAGARFAVLAAGMKDGSVCLWHYTPPDLTPAPAVQASDESFQPVGTAVTAPQSGTMSNGWGMLMAKGTM